MFEILTPAQLGAFGAIWFAAAAAPGGNVAFTVSVSSRFGFWAGVTGALGFVTALMFYLIVVAFGLGFAIDQYGPILAILRLCGVAYLLYLAWRIWHAPTQIRPDAVFEKISKLKVYAQGALICLTNPKAIIFAAVVLPQTINPERDQTAQLAILGLFGAAISLVVHSGYSLLGSRLGRSVPSPAAKKVVNRIVAVVFIVAAIGLGLSKLT